MIQIYAIVLMLASLLPILYTQYRIGFHTSSTARSMFVRVLLISVGILFGVVTVYVYALEPGITLVAIIMVATGVVHTPAAIILFLKRQRACDMKSSD